MRAIILTLMALMLAIPAAEAAKPKHNSHSVSYVKKHHAGPKPRKWCGWWMRTQFGGDVRYNRARLWANRGKNAGGPRIGAVVVWKHHVGIITGKASNGKWIVKSGNDSNRVRERPRSVANAIAFRML